MEVDSKSLTHTQHHANRERLTDGACPGRNSERGTWFDCAPAPDAAPWAGTVDLSFATLRSWWRPDPCLPSTRNSE